MSTTKTALDTFAEWIATTDKDHGAFAPVAIESFVDTIGCIAAGVDAELPTRVRNYVDARVDGPSGVLFSSMRTTRELGAFVNATTAHAIELDDWDQASEAHMSAVIVPALLALSEHASATGADLIDSYLVGLEVAMRFGEAINPGHLYRGWHPTSTIGALGGAAACARLLGLGARATASAISMATTNAGLKRQAGTLAKALHAGFAAQCAVQCALLAEAGVGAAHDVLDGAMGVEVLRSTADALGFAKAAARLEGDSALKQYGVIRKLYPTCGSMHRPMDGTTALMTEHDLSLDQVESLTVIGSRPEFEHLRCHNPKDVAESRFSIEFGAAAALAFGHVTLGHVCQETLSNPDYRKAFAKVRVETYEPDNVVSGGANYPPVELRLATTDGKMLSRTVSYARGWPEQPLSEAEVDEKFVSCVGPRLGDARTGRLLATIRSLPSLESAPGIIEQCG